MEYLDVAQFEAYVESCAKNSKVSVQWIEPNGTPCTNGKTMSIPKITSVTSNDWLTRIRYFVKHETSHIVHSDFDYLNEVRPTGLLALINNLIEDHRIDYLNDRDYLGDQMISSKFWTLYTQDVVDRINAADAVLSEQQLLVTPLFVWDALHRDWIDSSTEAVYAMSQMLDEDGERRLQMLLDGDYSQELLRVRESGTPQDVYNLSVRILRDIFEQDEQDYTDAKAKTTDATDSEGGGAETKEGKGGKPVDDAVDRIIDVSKLTDAIGHEHKPSRTGIKFTGTRGERKRGYIIPKPNEYVVVRFPHVPSSISCYKGGYFDKPKVNDYITSNAKPLANKLRIKLQTRSRDRYEYGKRKGSVHNGSLYRILNDDKPRVFRQRITSNTLDTAVCLLVDCSGSMSGNKFEMACCGAGAVSEALKPLNIPFTVLGFTNHSDRRDDPIIWVFNDFGERVPLPELVNRFATASSTLWENTDGDAIAYADHALHQRKEQRKVLIVLSDGMPAGRTYAGDCYSYTEDVISNAEKRGTHVYGIGICDDNVKHFYKNNEVVTRIADLTKSILNVLDRSI